jgi:SAM-dependent methyltransferase
MDSNIIKNLPDKTEYKNTTSHKFKKDLIDFCKDKKIDNALEIGANHGHTTNVLSYIANKVYALDYLLENVNFIKEVNKDRDNIIIVHGDAYDDLTYKDINCKFDLVFIDCVHTYDNAMADINRALEYFDENKGIYLVFDDYGHPHPVTQGVRKAVDDSINAGLKFEKHIGESKGYSFNDSTTLIGNEGIILSYGI